MMIWTYLRGLQELDVETKVTANLGSLESERLTLMDATLDPRSGLAGRTVGELNFRERYGIELAGIWREGRPDWRRYRRRKPATW